LGASNGEASLAAVVRGKPPIQIRGTPWHLSLFYIFDVPIDGNSSPGRIGINDLGVVTVRANGDEHYEGPLKKIK